MNYCKNCIFCERKNKEFVYCKNFEKSVCANDWCTKHVCITLRHNNGTV